MSEKRILFADPDSAAVAEYSRCFGPPWEVVVSADGQSALAEMRKQPCSVLVADLELPEPGGAELLNQIRQEFPKTLCFILAKDADRELVMKSVLGAHQFLGKPFEPSALKISIERALSLDIWLSSNSMRELVSRVRTFPTVPSLYLEVLAALQSPTATTEQVGRIIAKDMAMMTKLLQVINSACFGLPRKISDPVEAVGLIGFEAVKSMVMTLKLLSQYDKIKPVYFSIDRLWRHSTEVARTARRLTLMQTDNAALAETAFTAGLIHDLGKVVLAANFDEQYRGAQSLARKQKMPLWEVEREIFGAGHGEIGAYLLGLWGMPLDLLEVSALHHQPSRSISREFSILTAVHVANVLEHEMNPDPEESVETARIDEEYLGELGLLTRMDGWRETIFRRDSGLVQLKMAPGKAATARPKTSVAPVTKPEHGTPAAPEKLVSARQAPNIWAPVYAWLGQYWKLAGAVVGLGLMVTSLIWLLSRPVSNGPADGQGAGTGPRAAVRGTTSTGISSQPVNNGMPGTLGSLLSPTLTVRARTADTNNSVPTSAPAVTAQPSLANLKLQGIFYSPRNASAIINGSLVHSGERYAGMEVVEITSTSVTVESHNLRRTLVLK